MVAVAQKSTSSSRSPSLHAAPLTSDELIQRRANLHALAGQSLERASRFTTYPGLENQFKTEALKCDQKLKFLAALEDAGFKILNPETVTSCKVDLKAGEKITNTPGVKSSANEVDLSGLTWKDYAIPIVLGVIEGGAMIALTTYQGFSKILSWGVGLVIGIGRAAGTFADEVKELEKKQRKSQRSDDDISVTSWSRDRATPYLDTVLKDYKGRIEKVSKSFPGVTFLLELPQSSTHMEPAGKAGPKTVPAFLIASIGDESHFVAEIPMTAKK